MFQEPSGAMVPRGIMGTWLCDRIDEYHRQNPGQMAVQMLFEVAATATAPTVVAAGQSWNGYPVRNADQWITMSAESTTCLHDHNTCEGQVGRLASLASPLSLPYIRTHSGRHHCCTQEAQ